MTAPDRRLDATTGDGLSGEIADFIRYCYRKRQVSWPEIYDDMCAVAARGEFNGWRFADLAERGVGFTIAEFPRFAALVRRIVEDERERSPRSDEAQREARTAMYASRSARGLGERATP
jgi:hypothetical protein